MARRRQRPQGFDTGRWQMRVATEYENFMNSNDDDPERAKRFYARHNAGKAAINHVEALKKIEGNPGTDTSENSGAMLARARAALAQENILDEPEADY